MRRTSALALAAWLALGLALVGCERLQQRALERRVDELVAGDRSDWLEDGALHLVLCGTGSPLADSERAGPCAAVIAGGRFFLVDAGPGSWENVQLWRLPRARLSGLLLTHFHSDHIGELGEVVFQSWNAGREGPLPVYGPAGVVEVVAGFRRAYAQDVSYRVTHHGEETMPRTAGVPVARTIRMAEEGGEALVLTDDGLRITAFSVKHDPVKPAVGYRFDYAGRSVVISGDTARSENLVRAARGADLLLHEALAAHMIEPAAELARQRGAMRWAKLMSDIPGYHTTPAEALEVAREVQAKMLVLTHLVPPPNNALLRRVFLRDADAEGVALVVGEDGQHYTLPGSSDRIDRDEL